MQSDVIFRACLIMAGHETKTEGGPFSHRKHMTTYTGVYKFAIHFAASAKTAIGYVMYCN